MAIKIIRNIAETYRILENHGELHQSKETSKLDFTLSDFTLFTSLNTTNGFFESQTSNCICENFYGYQNRRSSIKADAI